MTRLANGPWSLGRPLRWIAAGFLALGSLTAVSCSAQSLSDAAPTTVTVTVTESGTPNDCGVGIWPPPIETTCGARPPKVSCNPGDPGFPNCV
jgi:hypothetical protein